MDLNELNGQRVNMWILIHDCAKAVSVDVMFPGFVEASNKLLVDGGNVDACKAVQGGLQCTLDLEPSEESLGAFGLFTDLKLVDWDFAMAYGSFEFSGQETDQLVEITK
jgi:hypothetical protein